MDESIPTPFESSLCVVKPEWIDHNGHMNVAYYLLAFDEAVGELFDFFGLTRAHKREHQCATFVGDFHIRYVRELLEGDPVRITHQLVGCDRKRMHVCQSMYHGESGYLAAQSEVMSLHIDMQTRKVGPMADPVFARISAIHRAHARLPRPDNQGRSIGVPAR